MLHSVSALDLETPVAETLDQSGFGRYRFHGRGGTAFEPVFDWVRLSSAVIPALHVPVRRPHLPHRRLRLLPPKPPRYPVLWTMTEHSRPDVPFGEVIRMGAGQASIA